MVPDDAGKADDDDAAEEGAEVVVDLVVDAEEDEGDVDGDGDLGIDDEASDDDCPAEESIKCVPPAGYELVLGCPTVADGALEGQHILVKWPEEDGGWVHAIVEKPYRRKNNAGKNYNVKYVQENVGYTHVLTKDTHYFDDTAPLESWVSLRKLGATVVATPTATATASAVATTTAIVRATVIATATAAATPSYVNLRSCVWCCDMVRCVFSLPFYMHI